MQLDNMLLQACKNNQKAVVQTFLKRGGVDVNKRDESGNTPLIYACMKSAMGPTRAWAIRRTGCPCISRPSPAISRLFHCCAKRGRM